jgi:hypothetical protein
MTTRKRYPTPTRHGDWRLINGQLVDASRHETPTASDANGSGDGAPTWGDRLVLAGSVMRLGV